MPLVKSTAGGQSTVAALTLALPAFAVNPANGDCIVVCQSWFRAGSENSAAPTDTFGNTYTRVNAADLIFGAFIGMAMWKAENIIGGASFVVTTRVATNPSTIASVARCLTRQLQASSAGDVTTNQTSGTTSATTAASGAAGGVPNSIYIACVSDGQTDPASYTPSPSWNDRGTNQPNNSSSQDLGTQDFTSLDQAFRTAVWTGPNSAFNAYGAIIASFMGPFPTVYVGGDGVGRRLTV